MPRKIKAIAGGKNTLTDNIETIYEKTITPYGTGAKIDAPKKHLGKQAYILIIKNH